MNKCVLVIAAMLLLGGSAFGQTPPTVEELQERLKTLVAQQAAITAENEQLKAKINSIPDNVKGRIAATATSFKAFKEAEISKACYKANGLPLIVYDTKAGTLTFSGCVLK